MLQGTPECQILLVDDDDEFREHLSVRLSDYGFQILSAKTAPAALELVSRHKPTLCVMEIHLPGVDGLQLVKYFRSRALFRSLPILILTRSIDKETLAQLVMLKVKGAFLKPSLSFEVLVGKILEFSPVHDVFKDADSVFGPDSSQHGESSSGPSGAGDPSSYGSPPPFQAAPPLPRKRSLDKASIQSLSSLRALPVVVEDIVDAASRPSCSLDDLERVLRKDPVIASRLIRSANSAAFLRGAPVGKIDDALRLLGVTNVVRIAIASGVISREDWRKENSEDLKVLWRNALSRALIHERLSPRKDAAANYAQSLFCNLPILLLIQHLDDEWKGWKAWALEQNATLQQVVELATECKLRTLAEEVFGCLNIPSNISAPLVDYYKFYLADDREEPSLSARRLDLINQIAAIVGRNGCGFSEIRCIHNREIDTTALLSVTNPEFTAELDLLESSIGILSSEPNSPGWNLGDVVLWRDPRWTSLDPIATFLDLCSNCATVNSIQDLLHSNRKRIAIAEPRTPEWETLRTANIATLVLHSEAVPDSEALPRCQMLKFPLTQANLQYKLHQIFR